jgi:hypothetical protein
MSCSIGLLAVRIQRGVNRRLALEQPVVIVIDELEAFGRRAGDQRRANGLDGDNQFRRPVVMQNHRTGVGRYFGSCRVDSLTVNASGIDATEVNDYSLPCVLDDPIQME